MTSTWCEKPKGILERNRDVFVLFTKWIKKERSQSFRNIRPNLWTICCKESWTRDVFILDKWYFVKKHALFGVQTIETNSLWPRHLRPVHLRLHSFDTTFISDDVHLRPHSFETRFVWDQFILYHIHFTPCQSEAVLNYWESHFYDLPSTSLLLKITCQTFCS